ncbi:Uncharacterised protein [Mycobacteroides abscessus subsp. abscessus]|uniref:hypothetical protein n=1 Tax=Mycobacteroides abscessus TaxID=36809 RepID=UPI0005DDFE5F|nr:hypothetical protein [Mycobacteroides abscessus]CPS43950.1 Uncharacterised protein [Mycobacteroides abscessus]CPS45769.1 Uncharacterised protein [Mycobacteroides abscessus]CPS54800.1 Uncharacterised protein [Mycobacteroides abscessus]CPT37724.1 Uncharacterised protein [Mycobacteroides abscessus]CPT64727.1 Uncharacterised protein [Mycobacteroides abscessus]
MAPVVTDGIDQPVSEIGQWIATALTFGLALCVLAWVTTLCRRERIVWPFFVLISGTLTCLMEPLFDHLYGLWFLEQGQWHLYTTFGSHQPIWVPAAYLTFYGGATVFIARTISQNPSTRTVWTMYAFIVGMAIAAEMTYVSILGVYNYQDSQPFVVLGYPIFLGFTNAMSALTSGIVVYRLAPLLRNAQQLYLIPLVPMMFAAGLFGSGILYLSVRHSVDNPPAALVHLAALTVVGGIASTVGLLGKLLVEQTPASLPAESLGK